MPTANYIMRIYYKISTIVRGEKYFKISTIVGGEKYFKISTSVGGEKYLQKIMHCSVYVLIDLT